MKKIVVTSISGLALCFNASHAEKLSAEFTNAKISTVVDAFSQISNFNVVWDKDAMGQKDKLVSISIRKPVDATRLFSLILIENGFIPIKEGDIYRIKTSDEYVLSVPPEIIKAFGNEMFDGLVMEIKKYVSPSAFIQIDRTAYSIIIKDSKDNVNRIKSVVATYLDSIKKQSEDLAKVQEKEGQFVKKEFNMPYESFKTIEDKISESLGMYGKYDYDKSKEKLTIFDTKENIAKISRIVNKTGDNKVETRCYYARGLDASELLESIKENELSENGTVVFKSKEALQVASNDADTSQANQSSQTIITSLPKICITDTAKVIEKIKYKYSDYLLDKPYQISIEARIVQVNTSNLKDLGIQWGGLASNIDNNNTKLITGGGSASISAGGHYAVDFPAVSSPSGGFAIGFTLGGLQNFLDVRLSALQSVGKSKILSKPQIITIDGETAEISQGYDIPYVTGTTATTPGNVQFKKAVLKLKVTPRTTADNNVIMDLSISQDAPDFQRTVGGNPPIQTRTVTSKVVAKDGSVIAIGGILETTESDENNGVPGIMNVPVLGNLFKNNSKRSSTSELLIFLSPKIIYGQ